MVVALFKWVTYSIMIRLGNKYGLHKAVDRVEMTYQWKKRRKKVNLIEVHPCSCSIAIITEQSLSSFFFSTSSFYASNLLIVHPLVLVHPTQLSLKLPSDYITTKWWSSSKFLLLEIWKVNFIYLLHFILNTTK